MTTKSMFRPISTFQDSALGSSLRKPSDYAASAVSHSSFRTSATEGGAGSLRVPATPQEVELGMPFTCPICGDILDDVTNRYQWKVHVFADLEAYICTFEECQYSLATFPNRELWASHEFSVHRKARIWMCEECHIDFSSKEDWQHHYKRLHHLESSGADFQATQLASERFRDRDCPLCFKRTSGKLRDIVSHVGKHMEAVALSALPKESLESDSESDKEYSPMSDEEVQDKFDVSIARKREGSVASSALSNGSVEYAGEPENYLIDLSKDIGAQRQAHRRLKAQKTHQHEQPMKETAASDGTGMFPIPTSSPRKDSKSIISPPKRNLEFKSSFTCTVCNAAPFDTAADLAHHAVSKHTRPYLCAFDFAGCEATFASKNEWKRHVNTQHMNLQSWHCNLDSCGKAKTKSGGQASSSITSAVTGGMSPSVEFHRKDLFTQHLRRMHAPTANQSNPGTKSGIDMSWEEEIKRLQESCLRQNRQAATKLGCPSEGCGTEFEGQSCWDDRMEHIAKHLESAALSHSLYASAAVDQRKDELFVEWAMREGLIERDPGGGFSVSSSYYYRRDGKVI